MKKSIRELIGLYYISNHLARYHYLTSFCQKSYKCGEQYMNLNVYNIL